MGAPLCKGIVGFSSWPPSSRPQVLFVVLGAGAALIRLSEVAFRRATLALAAMTVTGAIIQMILPAQAPWPVFPALMQERYHASALVMPYATLPSMHVAYCTFAAGLVTATVRSRLLLAGAVVADWIKATMLGAGVAWLLGMVPSTVVSLLELAPASGTGPATEPSVAFQYGLALALGAVTGPVLGLGQWLVLRRHVSRAGRWIVANAVAWAVGMVVIFLGMDLVPWAGGGIAVVLGVYIVCGTAGLVVGAIHGRVLSNLLQEAASGHAAA
jgi:hypothetical protein